MKEIIYHQAEKQRLDKYLVEELTHLDSAEWGDFSRSQIQKLIKDEQILVNDKPVSSHYQLRMGDKVEIKEARKQESIGQRPISLWLKKSIKQEEKNIPEVLYKTADYLIINKPAGLIIHPAESVKEPTLADWLIENYPQIKFVGENPIRPGMVHRLDKEVSGIMIIALSQKMFEHLKKQFQAHQVKKEYLALVHGVVEADEGKIDFPMERSKLSGKMVSRPRGEEGRESITEFIVLKRYSRYTYLKISILTGRTHQIRSHLQAYGYPIVGDTLYKNKKILENLELNRLFLHAQLLSFLDINNELQEFEAKLPSELKNILKNLK